jgi:hypothetical protein
MAYEDDIEIDETALDVEWIEQPRLMAKYCQMKASAQKDLDYAKEHLDVVRARVDKMIRDDPDAFGLAKVTEGTVSAAILMHDDYRKANDEYIGAKYDYNIAEGVVRAFDQRKSALENLVRLHGQSYFAGPSVPRNLSEARSNRDADIQRRVKIRKRGAA